MGYLFLIFASLAGISKVVAMKQSGKVCSGEYNSVRINSFRALICFIVSVCTFFVTGAKFQGEYLWICFLSGISNAVMMFVWILCTQRMGLIFVETFCLIGSTAIPVLISPFLYANEGVSLLQWIGVACLFSAVIFLSLKVEKTSQTDGDCKAEGVKQKPFDFLTVVYVILLIASNVGVSVTQKLYPSRVGSEYTAFFNLATFTVIFLCFALVLAFGKIFKKKSLLPDNPSSWKKLFLLIAVAAVMIYLYQYLSTLAAAALPSAVFYPLARGISMFLTVVCDVLLFKQKITKNIVISLIFIFAAIILTNL